MPLQSEIPKKIFLIKAHFLRYIALCLFLVLGTCGLTTPDAVAYAQQLDASVNLIEFFNQDANLQDKVVELLISGRTVEAANTLDKIAARDEEMAPKVSVSLRNTLLRSSKRCRELSKILRYKTPPRPKS
jgi:hypothetical protein